MTAVLLALTSHDRKGESGEPTGFYVPEAAHPWDILTRAGVGVGFVSVQGGAPPQDGADRTDPVQARFLDDPDIARQLATTPRPDEIDPGEYDAILFVGGHGAMWDFPDNGALQRIARDIYEAGGAVAAVCHGPAALVNLRLSDGSLLVAGRTVAAFSDDEERAVGLADVVPFLLATRLVENGARHTSAEPFHPHVEVDGRLVTGQNPASAGPLALSLLDVLKASVAVDGG